ncbi:perilipin-2-like [Polymixia lowei]
MEPQISIANDLACKGLDWLETAFPVLQRPTEEIAASAKNKMLEVKDVVSIVGNGIMDCVQHTITIVIGKTTRKMTDYNMVNPSLVERAINVAGLGLDSALNLSEALMDLVLPQADMDEQAKTLEGFEVATVGTSYSVRMVSLTAQLCRRTYHKAKMHNVKVLHSLSKSPGVVEQLQASWLTLAWGIHSLPQYVQHQAVCAFFFVLQLYNFSCPVAQQNQPDQVTASPDAALHYYHNTPFNWLAGPLSSSTQPDLPQAATNGRLRKRPAETPFHNGRNAKC